MKIFEFIRHSRAVVRSLPRVGGGWRVGGRFAHRSASPAPYNAAMPRALDVPRTAAAQPARR